MDKKPPVEIERNPLGEDPRTVPAEPGASTTVIRHGYLSTDPERTVLVRTRSSGEAWMTVKGKSTGSKRTQVEFPIPPAEAEFLLDMCAGAPAEKRCTAVVVGGQTKEIADKKPPVEIERKFLVADLRAALFEPAASTNVLRQGYLSTDPERTVRVRTSSSGEAWMTVKGKSAGSKRTEVEFPIPPADAEFLLDMCAGSLVEKRRTAVAIGGQTWEIDEYFGDLSGLATVEAELDRPDQPLDIPAWVGREVTDDHRYSNASLALRGLPDDFGLSAEPLRTKRAQTPS